MANGLTPQVEVRDLSSNWKKLQETLKADTSKPPKRKAGEIAPQPQCCGVKRIKVEHRLRTAGRKTGKEGGETVIQSQHHSRGNPSRLSGYKIGKDKPESKRMGLSWSTVEKKAPSASLALWAEDNDISAQDLAEAYGTSLKSTAIPDSNGLADRVNEGLSPTVEAGKYIAIDCEMVGVGPTPNTDSALARVSLVNYHGHQLYDSFVLPKEPVTDYRTHVSGITPELLQSARTLKVVQAEVAKLLDGKILIGHAIKNDLSALLLGHSKRNIRDTSRYPPFRRLAGGKTPSLKKLARDVLGMDIQGGEHSSIEDARATMLLFRREKDGFQKEHTKRWGLERKEMAKAVDTGVEQSKIKPKKKKRKTKKA